MVFDTRTKRSGRIFASQAAGVLGVNPHRGSLAEWAAITGRVTSDGIDSLPARLGRAVEGVVGEEFTVQTGLNVWTPHRSILDDELPIGGTPDFITGSTPEALDALKSAGPEAAGWWKLLDPEVNDVAEAKSLWSPSAKAGWGEKGTDQVPDHHRIQGSIYMRLTRLNRCHFPRLDYGSMCRYVVYRDMDYEAALLASLCDWHTKYIVADVAPPATGGDLETLRALYRVSKGIVLDVAGTTWDQWHDALLAAEVDCEKADGNYNALRAQFQEALLERDGMAGTDWTVTFKTSKAGQKTDWEAVARALAPSPADLEARLKEFTRTVPGSRRWNHNPKKAMSTQ